MDVRSTNCGGTEAALASRWRAALDSGMTKRGIRSFRPRTSSMIAAAASLWDVAGVVTGTSFSMDTMVLLFFSQQLAVIRASRLRRAEEHGLGRSVLEPRRRPDEQTVDAGHECRKRGYAPRNALPEGSVWL